jgi:hypothetical protein
MSRFARVKPNHTPLYSGSELEVPETLRWSRVHPPEFHPSIVRCCVPNQLIPTSLVYIIRSLRWRRCTNIRAARRFHHWPKEEGHTPCPYVAEIGVGPTPRWKHVPLVGYRPKEDRPMEDEPWEYWRGSFSLLAAIMKLSAHMCGLIERMRGPQYDCFGPWPMCPASVANMF